MIERMYDVTVAGQCGALWCSGMGCTFAYGSMSHRFESEHRLLVHHSASAFSNLRLLAFSAHRTIQFVACCSSLG